MKCIRIGVMALVACICNADEVQPMRLSRVIVASDYNDLYLPFWPLVARAWKQIVGLEPTLILVANESVVVDESVGSVIRFTPVPGVPTGLQAQIIRLFMPSLFPDDVCLIADIDLIPLCKNYFVDSVKYCPSDAFVVYRDNAQGSEYARRKRYPMCYVAAQGSTFAEIFSIDSQQEIRDRIVDWYGHHLGASTDELMMYRLLHQWRYFSTRCIQLGHIINGRVDRSDWHYDLATLRAGEYIDAHLLRPYKHYKQEIDMLAHHLGIDSYLAIYDEDMIKKTIASFFMPNSYNNPVFAKNVEEPSLRVMMIGWYDDVYTQGRRILKRLVYGVRDFMLEWGIIT